MIERSCLEHDRLGLKTWCTAWQTVVRPRRPTCKGEKSHSRVANSRRMGTRERTGMIKHCTVTASSCACDFASETALGSGQPCRRSAVQRRPKLGSEDEDCQRREEKTLAVPSSECKNSKSDIIEPLLIDMNRRRIRDRKLREKAKSFFPPLGGRRQRFDTASPSTISRRPRPRLETRASRLASHAVDAHQTHGRGARTAPTAARKVSRACRPSLFSSTLNPADLASFVPPSACHRCFTRKVRCSGQPETGHACSSCLRTGECPILSRTSCSLNDGRVSCRRAFLRLTNPCSFRRLRSLSAARHRGHDPSQVRCSFEREGLCSEEGGPTLSGEILPGSTPTGPSKFAVPPAREPHACADLRSCSSPPATNRSEQSLFVNQLCAIRPFNLFERENRLVLDRGLVGRPSDERHKFSPSELGQISESTAFAPDKFPVSASSYSTTTPFLLTLPDTANQHTTIDASRRIAPRCFDRGARTADPDCEHGKIDAFSPASPDERSVSPAVAVAHFDAVERIPVSGRLAVSWRVSTTNERTPHAASIVAELELELERPGTWRWRRPVVPAPAVRRIPAPAAPASPAVLFRRTSPQHFLRIRPRAIFGPHTFNPREDEPHADVELRLLVDVAAAVGHHTACVVLADRDRLHRSFARSRAFFVSAGGPLVLVYALWIRRLFVAATSRPLAHASARISPGPSESAIVHVPLKLLVTPRTESRLLLPVPAASRKPRSGGRTRQWWASRSRLREQFSSRESWRHILVVDSSRRAGRTGRTEVLLRSMRR